MNTLPNTSELQVIDPPQFDEAAMAKIAHLARIRLQPAEMQQLGRDLAKIVHYVAELSAVDTKGVAPMIHPGDAHMRLSDDSMRDDVVQAALGAETALRNAPQQQDGCFVVPRVVG